MHPGLKTLPRVKQMQQRNKALSKTFRIELCPWGCTVGTPGVDEEKGYCRHVAGWTLDGKTVEVRQLFCPAGGSEYEGIAKERDEVRPTDRIVDMGTPTSRVYRYPGAYPLGVAGLPDEPKVAPDPISRQMAAESEREAALLDLIEKESAEKKLLAERIDRLEKMLAQNTGDTPSETDL